MGRELKRVSELELVVMVRQTGAEIGTSESSKTSKSTRTTTTTTTNKTVGASGRENEM